MSEQNLPESLQRIDFWSRYAGLFFALVAYVALLLVTKEGILSAIVAASAAIGIRIGIPYYAILTRYTDDEGTGPVMPGDVNHGSVSGAFLVAAAVTLVAVLVQPNESLAYGVGIAAAVGSYFLLTYLLPDV
jgi:hypothetical protein